MKLYEKLKVYREKEGLSQNELAKKMNVTRQSVSRWETGKSYPDLDNLIFLSNLYNVSLDDLLKDTTTPQKHPTYFDLFDNHPNDFLILGTIIITCLIPFLGLILNLFLIAYCHKNRIHLSMLYKIIIFVCLLINLSNAWIFLNIEFFHIGEATIEKVASL